MQEYEFIYKKPLVQEFLELNILDAKDVQVLIKEQMKKCTWYWGQPRMNPATIAGLFRMMIKELKQGFLNKSI